MKEIKTLIIEDNEKSRDLLKMMVSRFNNSLLFVGEADNISLGLKLIKTQNPDLIFLDVEFPDGDGFGLLESLESVNFEIIFMTGFNHYAIKAIKHAALDYLLKPLTVNELKEAIRKAEGKINTSIKSFPTKQTRIALPTGSGLIMVTLDDIIYCKADSNYTYFELSNKKQILITRTLAEFEKQLQNSQFLRIHKTYLINTNHIKRYINGRGGQVEMSNGHFLDVSRQKKQHLIDTLTRV